MHTEDKQVYAEYQESGRPPIVSEPTQSARPTHRSAPTARPTHRSAIASGPTHRSAPTGGIKLLLALLLAAAALTLALVSLSPQPTRAQSNQISVDKRLGRASPVVFVGEYLTFTIRIVNNSPFTVTTLPLLDEYNAGVLGYADAAPAPDHINPASGRLDWDDLTSTFGDLPPGGEIVVIVGFIAEHPQTAVVNRAAVHDALSSGGSVEGGDSDDQVDESVGGSSPVHKEIQPGLFPQVGMSLTFTIWITNDGYVTMTVVPLVDTYNPSWMTFSHALPPPDQVDLVNGVLTWTDVTSWTGDIPAHGVISITTIFTPLAVVTSTANQAEVVGARDWYSNDLAGGVDLVPITIIEPTAVKLLYFRLKAVARQHVQLEWATQVEVDHFGFNLYRSATPNRAQAKRVTTIATASHDNGASYAYTDVVPAGGTWWYWLADVSTAGQETLHGPVRVSVKAAAHTVYLPLVIKD